MPSRPLPLNVWAAPVRYQVGFSWLFAFLVGFRRSGLCGLDRWMELLFVNDGLECGLAGEVGCA